MFTARTEWNTITEVMKYIEKETCITFKETQDDSMHRLAVVKGRG